MGGMRNASKYDSTHRLLAQAGMELFVEKDFQSVSVSDICAATGVSRSNFYLHFKSREQIVFEYFQRLSFVSPGVESWIARGCNPWARFVRHEMVYMQAAFDPQLLDLSRVYLLYLLSSDSGSQEQTARHSRQAGLVPVLRSMQAAGIVRNTSDPSYLAAAVDSLSTGCVFKWCTESLENRSYTDYFWSLEALLMVDDLYRGAWKEEENIPEFAQGGFAV